MLDLKTDKLYDPGKEDEGKMIHLLQVLGMNEDLWDRARDLFQMKLFDNVVLYIAFAAFKYPTLIWS